MTTTGWLSLTVLLCMSCGALPKTQGNFTREAIEESANKTIEGAVVSERLYAQSRGILRIDIGNALIKEADTIELTNEGTKQILFDEQIVDSLASENGYEFLQNNDGIGVVLYLMNSSVSDFLPEAESELRLRAASGDSFKSTSLSAEVRDFDIASTTTVTSFETNIQNASTGFQGWVSTVEQPKVKNKESQLVSDPLSIVNDL